MNNKEIRSSIGLEDTLKLADTGICRAFGRTGIGGRSENQDSCGGGMLKENVILTVCDGMGGMNGGHTASIIAVTEIVKTILGVPVELWNEDLIVNAVVNANSAIYKKSMLEPQLRGMGTTATVLMLTPDAAFLTHVGDSRIYQLRGGRKVFRTFDHSRVFEMVAQNMMTEEQARTSSFSNVITRALGIRPSVEVKVTKIPYKKGDRFVLCSDGIWNCLPEPRILALFSERKNPLEEVNFLTERINGIGVENGEVHDNLTAVIADIKNNSRYQYGIMRTWKNALGNLFGRQDNKVKSNQEQNTGTITIQSE